MLAFPNHLFIWSVIVSRRSFSSSFSGTEVSLMGHSFLGVLLGPSCKWIRYWLAVIKNISWSPRLFKWPCNDFSCSSDHPEVSSFWIYVCWALARSCGPALLPYWWVTCVGIATWSCGLGSIYTSEDRGEELLEASTSLAIWLVSLPCITMHLCLSCASAYCWHSWRSLSCCTWPISVVAEP